MKCIYCLLIIFLYSLPACDTGTQKNAAQRKELELNQREQDLLSREQQIQLREAELVAREKHLDSASRKLRDTALNRNTGDTLSLSHPQIPGLYNVTMICTKTNCTGSAVGDTKNEQWDISYEQNLVVIKAMSDKKVIRTYKGGFLGPAIELEAQPDSLTTPLSGKIIVRLQETKENRLDGVREITRQDDCRIIYDLDLRKQ